MGTSEKDTYRKRNRESMKRKYDETKSPQNVKKQHDLDYYISKFHSRIKEGPYYVCSVCNHLLYRKSVKL